MKLWKSLWNVSHSEIQIVSQETIKDDRETGKQVLELAKVLKEYKSDLDVIPLIRSISSRVAFTLDCSVKGPIRGMTTPATIPSTTITITSSTRVKPPERRIHSAIKPSVIIFLPVVLAADRGVGPDFAGSRVICPAAACADSGPFGHAGNNTVGGVGIGLIRVFRNGLLHH